jgi:hypothetical protein
MATSGNESVTAAGIHDMPATDSSVQRAATAQLQDKIRRSSQAIRYHLMADVLQAVAGSVAGIPILGPAIAAQLSAWADDLEARAVAALSDAATAQGSANYANTQVQILMSGMLASDVSGGLVVSDQLSGPSADDLGAGFTRTRSDGPGAGQFGLNGTGRAVWKKSGAAWRRFIFRSGTTMFTDYHSVHTIIGKMPDETPWGSDDALVYLCGRMSADGTEFVWLAISRSGIEIGTAGSGGLSGVYSLDMPVSVGDQFTFVCGSDAGGINNFQVKQNGVVKTGTNISFSTGSGYRGVGIGAKATSGAFFQQVRPAELEMWAANDRQPSTI